MLPWREACQEQPTEDLALNLRIAGRTLRLTMNGVKRKVRRQLQGFLTQEPAQETLALADPWDPALYRENLRQRIAEHLIARDILPIYARTVVIDRRGLLLVGEKKHEAAYRLHQRLNAHPLSANAPRARVLMGSVQALQIAQRPVAASLSPSARDCSAVLGGNVAEPSSVAASLSPSARDCFAVPGGSVAGLSVAEPKLIAHATPFTDRYPWEENPAALDSAPGSVNPSAKSSGISSAESSGISSAESSRISSAEITRILILPADVAFLSSEDFDPDRLFTEQAPVAASLSDGQRPVLGDSVAGQKAEQPDLLPSIIKALVLPDGLDLRLRALALAGEIAKLF